MDIQVYILNFDPVDSDDFTEWSIKGGKPRIVHVHPSWIVQF